MFRKAPLLVSRKRGAGHDRRGDTQSGPAISGYLHTLGIRSGAAMTVRIVERPGLWMSQAELDALCADLRVVASKTLAAGSLTCGVFSGERSRLEATIITLVRCADGTHVAFNALSVMEVAIVPNPAEVLHLGLVMVAPDERSKSLSWVLYGLIFFRRQFRPVWISNVKQVPAVVEAFHVLVLIAAALIPLAVLIMTEGLLRGHAPSWIKAGVGVGTVMFVVVAFVPTALADPVRIYSMLSFQMAGLLVAGWLVLRRGKASLSAQENRTVERLGLSLILLIPLAAADFLMNQLGLQIQISALAVLFLCWLAISLGREEARHGSALVGFVAVVLAAGAASALLAVIAAMDKDAVIVMVAIMAAALLLAVIVNDARALRGEEESLSLLRHLADGADDPLLFLRGMQAHPLVEGAALIEADTMADLDQAVLSRILAANPVLRRTDPLPGLADHPETRAEVCARFGIGAERRMVQVIRFGKPMGAAPVRACRPMAEVLL